MSFAYLTHLSLEPDSSHPLFLQLRDGFVGLITKGLLQPSIKLPTSRYLAEYFQVHRKTVVAAMDALTAEQWVQAIPRKGLFVNDRLPILKPRAFGVPARAYPEATAFPIRSNPALFRGKAREVLPGFDDGYPDGRLAPLRELGRAYAEVLNENRFNKKLSRSTPSQGTALLRQELARMMNTHRGLAIGPENILLTKGSQMAYYFAARVLLKKGDNVIVTSPSYRLATVCYEAMGATLIKVGVDSQGMQVDEVERICRRKKIRCLDITSHHHYPTTVSLTPERRIKLLHLAQQYGYAIIEDDYDYDFHYENRPLLPIASTDRHGHVVYIGSFSKIISHAFRVGYIIAPVNLIQEISYFRRIVDLHSDPVLEEAIGRLLASGTIRNHIRKALACYKTRRDSAHSLLQPLNAYLHCSLPEGGLAFWSLFDKQISLPKLSALCEDKGIYLSDGAFYNYDVPGQNGCRMGFASLNEKEMERAVSVLEGALRKL